MVHEGNDYASRTQSHQGLRKLFVHVCIMLQTIAHKINERNNPREEDTGKWKCIKHPLILATTVPQPLPAEAD